MVIGESDWIVSLTMNKCYGFNAHSKQNGVVWNSQAYFLMTVLVSLFFFLERKHKLAKLQKWDAIGY